LAVHVTQQMQLVMMPVHFHVEQRYWQWSHIDLIQTVASATGIDLHRAAKGHNL